MKFNFRYCFLIVILSCAAILICVFVHKPRIAKELPSNLQSAVEILRRSSMHRDREDRVPRDYKVDDHPLCVNSWRIKLPSIGWYSDSPGFDSCWKSS